MLLSTSLVRHVFLLYRIHFPTKSEKKNSIGHFPFHSTARQIKYIQLSYVTLVSRLLFPHPFFGRSSRCLQAVDGPPPIQALSWRRPEGSQTPQLIAFAVAPPESETCETKHRRGGTDSDGRLAKAQVGAAALLYVLDFSITDETKVLYLACYFHRIFPLPAWHTHIDDCKYNSYSTNPVPPDACVRFLQPSGKLIWMLVLNFHSRPWFFLS